MSLSSIKIQNLLSFEEFHIKDFQSVNCIIGRNNTGKSNLLKLIKFFYQKLENKKVLTPELNSNYSSFGTITMNFNLTHLMSIIGAYRNKDVSYFQKLNKKFLKYSKNDILTLSLQVNSDDSIQNIMMIN